MTDTPPAEITAYIDSFPVEVAERLRRIRGVIRAEAPESQEKMRYGIAAVMLGGRYALHYAGWKNHIGLYPVPRLPEPLESEVGPYRSGKDSVVFPHKSPVPYEVIGRVTAHIVQARPGV